MATGGDVENTQLGQVDVVFLAYKKTATKRATVTLDSVCTVSLYELERHLRKKRTERNSMSAEAFIHYRWYNAALVDSLRATGGGQPRPLLRVFHWYIETSNVDAFRVEGKEYEAISFVVAAEVEHWYYARRGYRSYSGSRVRVYNNQPERTKVRNDLVTTMQTQTPFLESIFRRSTTTNLERIGEEV